MSGAACDASLGPWSVVGSRLLLNSRETDNGTLTTDKQKDFLGARRQTTNRLSILYAARNSTVAGNRFLGLLRAVQLAVFVRLVPHERHKPTQPGDRLRPLVGDVHVVGRFEADRVPRPVVVSVNVLYGLRRSLSTKYPVCRSAIVH